MAEAPTPEHYYQLGQMMAGLHAHAETLRPLPEAIQPKRWDKVFYYPDEPVIYRSPAYAHLFTPERITLIDQFMALAAPMFEKLFSDEEKLIILHGDVQYYNVHVHRGQLYLLDFEDIMLGCPVQGLAITLYYGRDEPGYPAWREALQAGYGSVCPWPVESEQQLHTLMMARTVNFINYAARILESWEDFIALRCEMLKAFLARYVV